MISLIAVAAAGLAAWAVWNQQQSLHQQRQQQAPGPIAATPDPGSRSDVPTETSASPTATSAPTADDRDMAVAASMAPRPESPSSPTADAMAAGPADPPPTLDDEFAIARAAMAELDFFAAEEVLEQALQKAEGGSLESRVRGWQELLHYARGFSELQQQAIAAVTSGNEYDTPAGKVAIVESDADSFSFRAKGRTVRRTPATIPTLVRDAIVADWLDERPANQLFLGAHHATKPEPDLDAARRAWQQAAQGGVDASVLLPLLEDPLLAAP